MSKNEKLLWKIGKPHHGDNANWKNTDREVQKGIKREFRLNIGPIGGTDYAIGHGPRLSPRAQLREDANTLCLSLSLRLTYHPDATYILPLADHPQAHQDAVLRALAGFGQFVVRQGRKSGDFHISQRDGWKNDPETPDSSTEAPEESGIFSSGDLVEVEELDDLTIHLRQSVNALMAALKPFKVVPTHQLELF